MTLITPHSTRISLSENVISLSSNSVSSVGAFNEPATVTWKNGCGTAQEKTFLFSGVIQGPSA
jgi:hypothetical protein